MEKDNEAIYGPILPQKLEQNETTSEEVPKNDTYGPSLPPHLQKPQTPTEVCIGPILPPHLRQKLLNQAEEEAVQDESSEDETYGPMMPGQEIMSKARLALEERALEMKLQQLNPEELRIEREEWMTELPTVSASKLGLGPRQFRPNAGPDMSDRSSWTDTPSSKKQKKPQTTSLKEEREMLDSKKRDKEQEKIAKSHKRESRSLVELHQKKMKKETKKEPEERKPFNRETDLQVNRFDEAQKAAVLKKAQLLDDRFSQGKSKFL